MKLETIKGNNKKRIIMGSMIVLSVVSVLTFTVTRAKYRSMQSVKLANGIVDYKAPDLKLAIMVSEDGINYKNQTDIPTGDYTFNTEKSKCRVPDSRLTGENAPIDEGVTIEYTDGKLNFLGLTKNDTKCYVYFYKTPDTEKPIISNVTTSVTKTEINVTVTASDNKEVTEYYYQLDSGTTIKETTNTHTFTGLNAGQTYTLKVYVKDGSGNTSDVTTKSVTTKPNGQTIDTIIAAIEKSTSYKTGTPDFTQAATGAETATNNGIYKVSDGMYGGYSYYWRGAATTNHVIFDNKCWRIVRINGDKTIRLIYNGAVQSGNTCKGNGSWDGNVVLKGIAYNGSYDNSSYIGWTYTVGSQRPSNANPQTNGDPAPLKTALESWYNSNISDKSKVVVGKFCNDRNIGSGSYSGTGSTFRYAAYTRLSSGTKAPQLSCSEGDIYLLDVGMITADEAQFAGASWTTSNASYYLYNGQYYWTMSPSYWHGGNSHANVLVVCGDTYGYLDGLSVNSTSRGVRPIINLRSDTTFNAGSNGTQNNPYIVQ